MRDEKEAIGKAVSNDLTDDETAFAGKKGFLTWQVV